MEEIERSYRIIKEPMSLWYIHGMLKRKLNIKSKKIGWHLRDLHRRNKIEFVGDRIKPIE
jgi:hypothetical protein